MLRVGLVLLVVVVLLCGCVLCVWCCGCYCVGDDVPPLAVACHWWVCYCCVVVYVFDVL